MTIFLALTVAWFLYAFFRFAQELLWGLGNVSPAETCPAAVHESAKKEPVPGGLVKDSHDSGNKNN